MTEIFVFGSNLAGRHGKGAALAARLNYGAIYGQGEGMQGRSYAIPTKDADLRILPIAKIDVHVARFLDFARSRPELIFKVTAIGCGLAGYKPVNIAWMFQPCPSNVVLPVEFHAGKQTFVWDGLVIHMQKPCPSCGNIHCMAHPTDPLPGDENIAGCILCEEWSVFSDSGDLRKLTAEESDIFIRILRGRSFKNGLMKED